MIKINVLLENSKREHHFKNKHGLSVFIEHDNGKLLLDTGSDASFFKKCSDNEV